MTPISPMGSAPAQPQRVLRVLVVDDSPVQRGMVVSLLSADPALTVVGTAGSGAEGIALAARLKPDVITMDLQMPEMDGLEATRQIMQETPTPVVIVTTSETRKEQELIQQAFGAGVLALVGKPMSGPNDPMVGELLRTVKDMAQIRVIRRWTPERLARPATPPAPVGGVGTAPLVMPPRPDSSAAGSPPAPAPIRAIPAMPLSPPSGPLPTLRPHIVAIGTSTGGPPVLQEILSHIPAGFPLPILIVQHMAPGFIQSMVDWLSPQCAVPIQVARPFQTITGPGIYVAPTDYHLTVQGRQVLLSQAAHAHGHRPSASVLFRSVATAYGARAIGVLLTGMGDDGAVGLRDMKRAGAITIAQDEATSVVFGMPAVAINMGVVDYVLPPPRIAPLLQHLATAGREF